MLKKQMPMTHHPWDLSPKQAIELQKQLSPGIIRKSTLNMNQVRTVAGILFIVMGVIMLITR